MMVVNGASLVVAIAPIDRFVSASDLASSVCNGSAATIVRAGTIRGTEGRDVIVGSPGADIINGNGGSDRICGMAGDDIISGGSDK